LPKEKGKETEIVLREKLKRNVFNKPKATKSQKYLAKKWLHTSLESLSGKTIIEKKGSLGFSDCKLVKKPGRSASLRFSPLSNGGRVQFRRELWAVPIFIAQVAGAQVKEGIKFFSYFLWHCCPIILV